MSLSLSFVPVTYLMLRFPKFRNPAVRQFGNPTRCHPERSEGLLLPAMDPQSNTKTQPGGHALA
jgi:hypothetical protein